MAHRRAPEVDLDLDDIWYSVVKNSHSSETAGPSHRLHFGPVFLLSSHPYLGRAGDHDLRPGLRSFPVGEYVMIYRIEDNDVLILRVLRGSRNIQALFSG
jgi:toxin ParE1/3/4